jgi:diguanylate cyclase (GGDEF)-like protein/PAS domain S-box-containing protein
MFRTSTGAYRALTVRARPLVSEGGSVIGAIVRASDTHDRDAILRALATLSQANRTLVRAVDEATLLQQTCEAIVHTGRYLFVWYGRPMDDVDQSVQPIAQAGESQGYLEEVSISWGDNPLGRGPTGRSIRLRQGQVSHDHEPDPNFSPWLEPASRRGFRCSISLPVFVDDQVDGALIVYAAETGAFDSLAQNLLEDLAADLGYGISRLREAVERAAAGQRLAESERRYRLLAENSSDVVMVGHREPETRALKLTWISPSARQAFGLEPSDMIGQTASDFIHPDDVSMVREAVAESERTGSIRRMRYRWRCGDGSYRWVESIGNSVDEDDAGEPGRIVALRDIDDEVRAQQELEAREAQYHLLAENASDVVWQLGPDSTFTWVSSSITLVLGWDRDELIGRSVTDVIHAEDQPRAAVAQAEVLSGKPTQGEYRILCKDGSTRWALLSEHSVKTDNGVTRIGALRDVHDEVIARNRLEFALGHDQLTGLPTRATMIERISAAQEQLAHFHVVGLMSIGVDGLAEVNEALTHTAGDLLLTTIAARIATSIDNPDHVGRGAGNELVVLVPDLRSGAEAGTFAERLRSASQGTTTIAGQQLAPAISIGIATGGVDADPQQLLRDASLALRKAKDNGRDRYEFADPGLAIEAQHRLVLDNDIREGVANGAFVPWFQPIVDLTSGALVGYESLVRWVRPGGTAQPFSFLDVAERSSLITDIDLAVLTQSIDALSRIPDDLHISVNVSVASLGRQIYRDQAVLALSRAGVDPHRLHIEVTETMLLNPTPAVVEAIQRLADLGVRWYIDDFGTGYASITSLRDLPMSGLKLDRSFTYGITSHEKTSMQLAQALVGLAEGLELDTIAEGVETQDQADFLQSLGWRHGQGWLFGRPAPLPDL